MTTPEHRSASRKKAKRKAPPHAWKPGQSGNPKGRAKLTDDARLARDMAREACPEAVEKLIDLMRNAEDERVQKTCADSILDRGLGRPTQPVREDTDNPFDGMSDEEVMRVALGDTEIMQLAESEMRKMKRKRKSEGDHVEH